MSAIDKLHKLLDERGVESKTHDIITGKAVTWHGRVCDWVALPDERGLAVGVYKDYLTPEQAIAATLGTEINGETSDGYHTFNELYHHRAVLFSVIVRDHRELAWKARKHHDGTMYDGMFIVGIETPSGQATYHYDLDPYWDMFDCEEREFAPKWDGHTPDEAIARIATLVSKPDEIELIQTYDVGFRNGVMAVFQQLEGIKDYEELQCFIADYWGEGEELGIEVE